VRLFHFSEDPSITCFTPRPVAVPSPRTPGREWLNGPLVWAIDEDHQALYLFPRDCPRILAWATPSSTALDRERWLGATAARKVAWIEADWLARLASASIHRYELPPDAFEDLDDAGMHVARVAVTPRGVQRLDDLPAFLRESGVELRVTESLAPLRGLWNTTLHASGIRLRHARSWRAIGE
jgi:hypothetical protein